MKGTTAGVLGGLFVGLALSAGCGYPCAARCDAMKGALAEYGYNPDNPNGAGGHDPETVCDVEAIQMAATCAECEEALSSTYRMWTQRIACDCPSESLAADAPEVYRILYYDQACMLQDLPFSAENCQQWQAEKHPDEAMCLDG